MNFKERRQVLLVTSMLLPAQIFLGSMAINLFAVYFFSNYKKKEKENL